MRVFEFGSAKLPPKVIFAPFAVSALEPLEFITTLPVLEEPKVRFVALVVERFPSPSK